MDERERHSEQEEFSLEDILKEFAGLPAGETDWELEEDVAIWGGAVPADPHQSSAVPEDTVRLDEITEAVKKLENSVQEGTQRFVSVGKEKPGQEEPPAVPVHEEKVEPFSEEWEPEYEQPMGQYIPPEPIVFQPKSRLQELKHKLIEGPEKRYYELAERGLGKLQTAIFLNLLVALLAAGSTAMYALGMVQPERMRLMVFGQFLALLLSALLGSYQLMEGFGDLLRKKFSLNTLLLFSFIACCADAILCLQQVRVPCCAAFSLNMTMSLWSAYQKRHTEMGQMDTMRKATRLDSVVSSPDYYEGRPGFLRGEGQVEDFMDTYNVPSGAEKTLSVYTLAALFASVGIGITAGLMHNLHMGIQVFCASLLVAAPATTFITLSRPMALLERRLHKHGAVICGWQGVLGMSQAAAFPLEDTDLFPAGSAKMNGVKFYGSRNPDEVVAYAAALVTADGGSMAPLFSQLLESRSGYHYDAENLQSYPGGIGGEVNEEAVLAGTLAFMQSMGVEMPEGTRVNQAVYVAIDGQLCGVFAVTYSKVKSSAVGLTTLCAYRGLTPVMTTGDFMLTESFLRGKFGVNTRRIAFPDRKVRSELSEREPEEGAPVLALTTREGLAGAAYAVTGSRALRSAGIAGVTMHMIGGILGLLIMLTLAIVGADNLLTPANILLYELIWMIPGMLITEWTRSV
ncbi:MAG: hypothetical protein J6L24_06265 [Oscillospiraceae bacterium]|nr:hypothetical protein [Oscillospiraceae bacterium]